MIRTVLYSLIIVLFFAALLAVGLLGPDQGKKVAQRILEFVHWKPAKKYEGVLAETRDVINQFNDSHRNIQLIRQMTLERSKKSFEELEGVYREARQELKQLLSDVPGLSVTARKELYDHFTVLHQKRAALVEEIIGSQQVLININEQMDQELRAISQWFQDKTAHAADPSGQDVVRLQQYENLKSNLKAFAEESSHLDSFRILFMKKNKDTVARLAETNTQLENRFRELISQIENSTPANSQKLWDDYQNLETEQRQMVGALNANEEFISDNQAKMLSGINVLSQDVEYSSDTHLQRFRDSFQRMEQQRAEMLIAMNQRQQSFADSQTSLRQLMENNEFKMEFMREQSRMIADQYQQMEEYRKSTVSMLDSMTQELKDQSQLASQQTDDVMEKSRVHMEDFMRKMDTAQVGMKSFIHEIQNTSLSQRPGAQKLINLNEKIAVLKANVRQSEQQMRSVVSQLKRNQESLSQTAKDGRDNYAEKLLSIKERTEDQKRIFSERVEDQMQNLKDRQAAQSQF